MGIILTSTSTIMTICANPTCSVDFIKNHSRQLYCGSSCSAIVNNSKYPKRGRVERRETCQNCQKEFNPLRISSKKFCSRSCFAEHRFKEILLPRFLRGEAIGPNGIKRSLKYTKGNICVVCKNKGIHNGKPLILQLDHIDGDSDNNLPENVRLLCPNCHTQTNNYGTKGARRTDAKRALRKRQDYKK